MFTQIGDVKIRLNFHEGIKVFVDGPDDFYLVEVSEYRKNEHSSVLVESYCISPKKGIGHSNHFSLPIEFYFDFEINIYKFSDSFGLKKIFSHRYNDTGKLIKIILNPVNYDEALIWYNYVEKFRKKQGCKIVLESPYNGLNKGFETQYLVSGIDFYKIYRIGRYPKSSSDFRTTDPRKEGLIWFGNWKTFWSYQHPKSWKFLSSEEIINDILNID